MKKAIVLIMLTVLGLASCTAVSTPKSVSSLVPTASATAMVFPTVTYTVSFTPSKVPTETPTLSLTLSPEEYPRLADVALKYEDIPSSDMYYSILKDVTIKDMSENLKDQFDCSLDCHGDLWSIPGFSISINLIKLKSSEDVYELSKDTCLRIGKASYALGYSRLAIAEYNDCILTVMAEFVANPPSNTWILPVSGHEAVLGSTIGTIFIFIRVYHVYPGDDFGGAYFLPLTQLADYQTQKLIKFGIPANP